MELFKNPFKRNSVENAVQVLDEDGFPLFSEAGLGFPTNLNNHQLLNDSMATAAWGYISRSFSEPNLRVMNKDSEEFFPFPELTNLLHTPNPNVLSKRLLLSSIGGNVGLLGNCYIRATPSPSLEILPTLDVSVERDTNKNNIIGYRYQNELYSKDEIFHIRGIYNPKDPSMGLNLLECLRSLIILDQRATAYLNLALEKLGMLGIFVSPNMNIGARERAPHYKYESAGESADSVKASTKRYNDSLSLLQAGKGVYWPSDASIEKVAPAPREMLALDIYRRTESRMAAVVAVSARLMEFEFSAEASTFNNIAIARRFVAETLLLFLWQVVEEQLTYYLLKHPTSPIFEAAAQLPPDMVLKFDTSSVAALQEDKFQETDRVIKLLEAGLITRETAALMLSVPLAPEAEGDSNDETSDKSD